MRERARELLVRDRGRVLDTPHRDLPPLDEGLYPGTLVLVERADRLALDLLVSEVILGPFRDRARPRAERG